VSGLCTLKPKTPKNLKLFLKNLGFFSPVTMTPMAALEYVMPGPIELENMWQLLLYSLVCHTDYYHVMAKFVAHDKLSALKFH